MVNSDKLSPAIIQSLGLSAKEIYDVCTKIVKIYDLKSNILDFGSGQGKLLKYLTLLDKTNLTGADLMPRPTDLDSKIEWIQADLNNELPVPDESFNSILAIEVIEHLENPRSTAREWKRILKKKGVIVLSTPNNNSIRAIIALILKGHFVSFLNKDYPAHITALTRLDINRVLTETGFKNIKFYYSNKGLIPGLRGLTWQNISFGLLKGEKFSDNVFAVAINE